MKKKLLGIFVCTLLIATALPAVGTMNIEKADSIPLEPKSASTGIVWSDNFDSYSLGQFLDGTPDDGGWKPWNGPTPAEGAYVVNEQSLSNPYSVEILGESDIVHEFTRICSGNWTFTDWVYVPTDFSGASGLTLDSYYPTPYNEYTYRKQICVIFDGDTGLVVDYPSLLTTLPLITEQWVEIRVEIDFEADWLECYYNDELLIAKNWTESMWGRDSYLNLAAVNIFYVDPMDTPVYHDDLSIEGVAGPVHELDCEGSLSWTDVKPGETVTGSFNVSNIGEPNSRLEWIIDEYPDFGIWSCDPSGGSLKPEDGPITINVSVKAPKDKNKEFTGELKLRAICDPDESCTIDVFLSTPKNKAFNIDLLFLRFLEQHPHMFPILRHMLGL